MSKSKNIYMSGNYTFDLFTITSYDESCTTTFFNKSYTRDLKITDLA